MNGNRRTRRFSSSPSSAPFGHRRRYGFCCCTLSRISNKCIFLVFLFFASVICFALLLLFATFSTNDNEEPGQPTEQHQQQIGDKNERDEQHELSAHSSATSNANTLTSLLLSDSKANHSRVLLQIRESVFATKTLPQQSTDQQDQQVEQHEQRQIIPVLVFSAKRPKAIANHLSQLRRLRPSASQFPIIVSNDGDDAEIATTVGQFMTETPHIYMIKHILDEASAKLMGQSKTATANYMRISAHYKWALDQVFVELGFQTAIITEDDLDIADDFFDYFLATRQLLDSDPTIWCISAFNDNGNPALLDWSSSGVAKLWRTDFFPGLGWMLTSKLWAELRKSWPNAYWDDHLRQQQVRKGRVCVRPEVSRTLHNQAVAGKGSSNGLYKALLASIRLPSLKANFTRTQVDQLRKENFDRWLDAELRSAEPIPLEQMLAGEMLTRNGSTKAHRVVYKDPREFRRLAQKFNLMADIRSGMARTAYYGVVPFRFEGTQFFAVHHALNLEAPAAPPLGTRPSAEVYNPGWDAMSKFLDFAEIYCKPTRWTGKCDPADERMRAWFRTKGWAKRLEQWGQMTVF